MLDHGKPSCRTEAVMKPEDDVQLEERFLQISPNILESFPRFRPPVNLHVWDEELASVRLLAGADSRLSEKRQQEVADHCRAGNLYLDRRDYREYAVHLSRNLGLVLVEQDLNPDEVSEIFYLALRRTLDAFFEQPIAGRLQDLQRDLSILCEYIWIDPGRTEFLLKTLDKQYDAATHGVNSTFVGLGVFAMRYRTRLERTNLNHLALGLAVHDMGMAMVPGFIRDKEGILLHRDKESVRRHPDLALGMLTRLKVNDRIVEQCVMEHHERLDGTGYPKGVRGDAVSLPGRLCGLADSFSAAIAERPYHSGEEALTVAGQLLRQEGRYDRGMARALLELLKCGFAGCGVDPAT
jgi:HD-GYP domain-containing protein (c-di-GMP phosphodiesterase class II)